MKYNVFCGLCLFVYVCYSSILLFIKIRYINAAAMWKWDKLYRVVYDFER